MTAVPTLECACNLKTCINWSSLGKDSKRRIECRKVHTATCSSAVTA